MFDLNSSVSKVSKRMVIEDLPYRGSHALGKCSVIQGIAIFLWLYGLPHRWPEYSWETRAIQRSLFSQRDQQFPEKLGPQVPILPVMWARTQGPYFPWNVETWVPIPPKKMGARVPIFTWHQLSCPHDYKQGTHTGLESWYKRSKFSTGFNSCL